MKTLLVFVLAAFLVSASSNLVSAQDKKKPQKENKELTLIKSNFDYPDAKIAKIEEAIKEKAICRNEAKTQNKDNTEAMKAAYKECNASYMKVLKEIMGKDDVKKYQEVKKKTMQNNKKEK